MSWAGFKKNVNRATTQVMMKTGHVEKTNDRDYEVEERRFRTMEAASNRLQKEARGYLDSLRGTIRPRVQFREERGPNEDHMLTPVSHSNDRIANAHSRDHRRILRRRWGEGRRQQELQAGSGRPRYRDDKGARRTLQNDCTRSHYTVLRLLPRCKRVYDPLYIYSYLHTLSRSGIA